MPPPWNPRDLIRRRARQAGVDLPDLTVEELAAYVADVYDAAVDDGATAADAEARARAAIDDSPFDTLHRHATAHPDARRRTDARLLARVTTARRLNVIPALRLALRQCRQSPAFAAIVVAVLGLGTGAAATVFTIVDAVVLRPLPYAAPDRLVTLWDTNAEKALAHDPISPVNFMDYRALPAFADGAAWWRPAVNLTDPGQDPVRVPAIEVSRNLFALLGVSPALGPGFPAEGPLFARDPIAVISDRLWRTRYGADPGIVGRPLVFNNVATTVVGVMPPGFHYPDDIDVWQGLTWDMTQHSRAAHFMEAVLRLSDGTTLPQARAAVDTLATRLSGEFTETRGWGARLVPLLDEHLGFYRPALTVLLGAVALLLLIAVLNVASLLLTRALGRTQEMAVRRALGAGPRQLVAQLLAESAVLSLGGAMVGVAVTWVALPLIVALMPVRIPRLDAAAVDLRALGLCLLVVGVTTVAFSLVPALTLMRAPVTPELKSGERGSSKRGRGLYAFLVAGEVAVACALLAGSALLVRSVTRMVQTPTGVQADDVLTVPVQITREVVGGDRSTPQAEWWGRIADIEARLLDEVRRQPGVEAAGAANFLPLTVGWRNPIAIEGRPVPARLDDLPQAQMHTVTDGYLEAMGVALRGGRGFTAADDATAPAVVLVNETFARRFLDDGGAVGRRLRTWSTAIGPLGFYLMAGGERARHEGVPIEIVGVVADVKNGPLGQPVEPAVFFPARQYPFGELHLAVRARDVAAARTAVVAALRAVVPTVPPGVARTWGDRFAAQSAEARLLMTVLLVFAVLAAVLAALGVYGLFSWSVEIRTRELAIRLTLGAPPATVGALVFRQGLVLVLTGLAAGLGLVRLAEAAIARVLFGVSPSDATALSVAGGLVVVAALAACVPPAIRAMRVNPVDGLRAS